MLSVGKLKWEFSFPVLQQKHFVTAEKVVQFIQTQNKWEKLLKFIFSSSTTVGISANLPPPPCVTS